MVDATENFNRAGPGLGANWSIGANPPSGPNILAPVINSSIKAIGQTLNSDHAARWNANIFENNQYSQIAITDLADGGGPIVRHQDSASTYYLCYSNSGTFGAYYEITDAQFAQLGADLALTAMSAGHILKLTVAGSLLTGNLNGSDLSTRTDSSITSGQPGFHIFSTTATWDNWQAGPIATTGTATTISYFGSASTPTDATNATNTADPTAVTPPGSMLQGDLVCMIGQGRAASMTLAISQASGQTWTTHNAISTTNQTARLFTCIFNGAWGSDPSVSFGATTCNSVQMHVFRPPGTNWTWAVNQALVELDIAAGTGIHTITGQTTTGVNQTVTLAGWFTADDNTWGTLTPDWFPMSTAQYRNTSGSDMSATYAYKVRFVAAATGNVTQTQLSNGADASTSLIISMEAVPPAPPDLNMAQYYSQ